MPVVAKERWVQLVDYPNYEVSDLGEIFNSRLGRRMKLDHTTHGHLFIKLSGEDGSRHSRSVAVLVAEAFVEVPNFLCDSVILLDGNLENVRATNLAWRPSSFAWNYTRQLKVDQPNHYHNLRVADVTSGTEYASIIEAGMKEGLLFDDIWTSCKQHNGIFPYGQVFDVVGPSLPKN